MTEPIINEIEMGNLLSNVWQAISQCSYWITLDKELKAFAAETGLDYVTNDDSMTRDFNAPPVIVNYFYHEQIKKSARKDSDSHAGIAGS